MNIIVFWNLRLLKNWEETKYSVLLWATKYVYIWKTNVNRKLVCIEKIRGVYISNLKKIRAVIDLIYGYLICIIYVMYCHACLFCIIGFVYQRQRKNMAQKIWKTDCMLKPVVGIIPPLFVALPLNQRHWRDVVWRQSINMFCNTLALLGYFCFFTLGKTPFYS